jgi:DNA-binding NarL/FixJ family response regulator
MSEHDTGWVRVGLVEDDAPYRRYVAGVLNDTGRFRVVAEANSAEAAATWPASAAPAVVLLDINLPGAPGTTVVRTLLEKYPGAGVVMLTARDDEGSILDAIRAGATGYVLKGTDSAELVSALDDVQAGGAPMSPPIARKVLSLMRVTPSAATQSAAKARGGEILEALTPRENDVLTLVAAGATDKEAAAKLGVSVSAIKAHLANIYAKWRVRSRTEAAIKFTQAGR